MIWDRLSPREKTVAECLMQGHNTKGIAQALGIKLRTVKQSLTRMYLIANIDKKYFVPHVRIVYLLWKEGIF